MSDPVSWFMIEPGWKVVDADGKDVGTVDEVVGDSSNDIFNGLAVSTSLLGKPRYVPAERIRAITDGSIELAMSKTELAGLGEFKEPPTTAEILPEGASGIRRAEAHVEAPIHDRPEGVNVWRRAWWAVRRLFR
ncbi:MAG: DUF2171 domain-containing protein [Actinobacteria bacterium]|jgi:hypothetical protein|nr:MAG: DUF2171 domain-containing protein [Actinomycetota bacterium]